MAGKVVTIRRADRPYLLDAMALYARIEHHKGTPQEAIATGLMLFLDRGVTERVCKLFIDENRATAPLVARAA